MKANLLVAFLNVKEGRLRLRNTSLIRGWLRKAVAAGESKLAEALQRELDWRKGRREEVIVSNDELALG